MQACQIVWDKADNNTGNRVPKVVFRKRPSPEAKTNTAEQTACRPQLFHPTTAAACTGSHPPPLGASVLQAPVKLIPGACCATPRPLALAKMKTRSNQRRSTRQEDSTPQTANEAPVGAGCPLCSERRSSEQSQRLPSKNQATRQEGKNLDPH